MEVAEDALASRPSVRKVLHSAVIHAGKLLQMAVHLGAVLPVKPRLEITVSAFVGGDRREVDLAIGSQLVCVGVDDQHQDQRDEHEDNDANNIEDPPHTARE
eukprot:CAMPEP_0171106960 /NCGR_PEP_ID=MMETSP0766_2-20121228/65877_1 /TAXON_ID=439317 /ORGANISM="Gambierdiscus australes, Strain CAWD 149" /LENGTH=101 /DNA_ID=CAMNT_0011568177 /DNA_START=118 /DNA_END=423 /DNA_ORIENTATION=-